MGAFADQSAQQLHVFDLPQLFTKPSADALLSTLDLLTSAPPSWDCSDLEDDSDSGSLSKQRRAGTDAIRRTNPCVVSSEGLPRYLTSIIGSDLRWIEDDTAKEMIWEQASLRLSERSGRSAMPAMTRTFKIPTNKGPIQIALHEPALTADNLGLKTWGSSYQLAKRLRRLQLPSLAKSGEQRPWCLELGAGTGLVGIAAAAVLGWRVCLTDLPDIVANLQRNVDSNLDVSEASGGQICAGILDWNDPDTLALQCPTDLGSADAELLKTTKFPVILVADALYSSDHPRLLAHALQSRLLRSSNARVVVELPLREAFALEREDFRARMAEIDLLLEDEGEDVGYDDWGRTDENEFGDEVKCWWSIWRWNNQSVFSPLSPETAAAATASAD